MESWIELPLVTPEQLNAARAVKVIFSGHLDNEINTYPKFPGVEKHLLKCQLVRITHAA